MKRLLALALTLCGCPEPTASSASPTASTTTPPSPSATGPAAIDVHVDFEEGPDPDFGDNASSVRGFVAAPALGVRTKLFAVPFPYRCERRELDASADFAMWCLGDDGWGGVRIRVEPGRVVVDPHDYGRIAMRDTSFVIALPAGSVATFFAPVKYPTGVPR